MSTRFAILVIAGAAALSVSACGSSDGSRPAASTPSTTSAAATPTTSPPAPTSAPPKGEAHVRGAIASVTGSTIAVTQQNGTAKVDFTESTKVTEVTAAALTDVTTGSCISVRSKDSGGQPVTAAAIRVSPAVNGACPPATSTGKHAPLQGTVASVAGNTITVTAAGAPQTVTVTDKTRYTKETVTTSQAIAQGKCIAAQGSQAGDVLQATTISLRVAARGKCFEGDGPHRR